MNADKRKDTESHEVNFGSKDGLKQRNQILVIEAQQIASEKPQQREAMGYIERSSYVGNQIKSNIAGSFESFSALNEIPSLCAEDIRLSEVPPNISGDIAISIPSLIRILEGSQKNPEEVLEFIASDLRQHASDLGILAVEVKPPHINLILDYKIFAPNLIQNVANLGERYGESDLHKGERILVDFSSPNVAKTMHIGHLRSTLIGAALSKIYEKCGYTTFKVNHLGDWGTQFGKIAVAYARWQEEFKEKWNKKIRGEWREEYGKMENQADPVKFMAEIYKKFNDDVVDHPELENQARDAFSSLEKGDPEMMRIWQQCVELSLQEFDRMYKRMGVEFDIFLGESFYENELSPTIQGLIDTGLGKKDEKGAVAIDLGDYPTYLVLKSNGGTTYITRDLAAFKKRKEIFGQQSCIYVVGSEQSLHMRQLFETTRRLGYNSGEEGCHVALGTITEKGGKKISSRKGAGGLSDILDDVVAEACNKAQANNPSLSPKELDEIGEKVGIGAVFFRDLQDSPHKGYQFDLESILSMKGKSGPFVQYALVRGKSILEKSKEELSEVDEIDWSEAEQLTQSEKNLLLMISRFPEIVEKACDSNSPHYIAVYLDSLAKAFNNFHHNIHVNSSESNLKGIRQHLVKATTQTLENGLNMLNIPIPEKM
ncbi:MAG: arginine--tRNA ligase [Candidatus Gracilibacteria bacterium]|jgi:arginyl-tRNA synthetase